MFWILVLLLLSGSLRAQRNKWRPGRLFSYEYYWPDYMGQERILALTHEIVKDVELKMVMSEYIQQSYYQSFDYEVGYMASAVKDLFRNMLSIYKANCQPLTYANRTINSGSFLDLLHQIQGDYREILMYRDLYVKAADEEERRQKKERQIALFKEMRKKTQQNLKASGPNALSREVVAPPEYMRPSEKPWYEKNKRTLKPGHKIPKDSKEWEALHTKSLRKRKDGSEHRFNKNQEEEKYKALLRENFNKARRGEPQDAGFR